MDPIWTPEPPPEQRALSLRLVRTPTGAPLRALVISRELIGCATHFYGGRTLPCTGPTCPACAEKHPWRWHGYLEIWRSGAREHQVLELTAQATDPLKAYAEQHGTLRRAQIVCSRPGVRKNGRVQLRIEPFNDQTVVLPEERGVRRVMAHIWQLPLATVRRVAPENRFAGHFADETNGETNGAQ